MPIERRAAGKLPGPSIGETERKVNNKLLKGKYFVRNLCFGGLVTAGRRPANRPRRLLCSRRRFLPGVSGGPGTPPETGFRRAQPASGGYGVPLRGYSRAVEGWLNAFRRGRPFGRRPWETAAANKGRGESGQPGPPAARGGNGDARGAGTAGASAVRPGKRAGGIKDGGGENWFGGRRGPER